MVVTHNLLAMGASRQFGITTKSKAKSTEKLSSGFRINRAADDAAGLAISEKMRRQIRGLTRASQNVQEGIGFVQTADGALNEVHDMLQRMNELAVKAGNETLSESDRGYIDDEVQQLKSEMARVFDTTTFNERLIWDPDTEYKVQVETKKKVAMRSAGSSTIYDVNNQNVGIIPAGSITILADKDKGIATKWKGNDGKTYETQYKKIDWDNAAGTTIKVSLKELFPDYDASDPESAKFYDSSGKPLIDCTFGFAIEDYVPASTMVSYINGQTISGSVSMYVSASDSTANSKLSPSSTSVNFRPLYESFMSGVSNHFDFETDIPDAITPVISGSSNVTHPDYTLSKAATNSDTWTIKLNLAGVGNVTGTLTSASTVSNDRSADSEGTWWYTYKYANGKTTDMSKSYTTNNAAGVTLAQLTDLMLGGKDEAKPGVLSTANGGSTDGSTGGYNLKFTLRDASSRDVGSISFSGSVTATTTMQDILDALEAAFNDNTVIDLDPIKNSSAYCSARFSANSSSSKTFDAPVFMCTNLLRIQAGTESGQYIDLSYDTLSLRELGLRYTNVATADDAASAIDEIKGAMQLVSEQRSAFGAYQNRLEHTYKNLDNVIENTTDAESQIRDTDMATEMVKYSVHNILEQAGMSMLVNANQTQQGVLTLLGG